MTIPLAVRRHVYGKRMPLPGMWFPRADTTGLPILPEVDPRDKMPAVFDQGQLGSCTANATCGAFQYDAIMDGHDCGRLARLWVYYYERAIEGDLGQGDTGAMGHDAFKVARHGIPDETLWPYDITTFEDKPGADNPRAYYLKKPVHAPAQSMNAIKQVLSNGQTIAFGFSVFESFENIGSDGIMPVPGPNEAPIGGHEMLAIGYTLAMPHHVLTRNSWGAGFGDAGYVWFPWTVFLDYHTVSDFRTIVRAA